MGFAALLRLWNRIKMERGRRSKIFVTVKAVKMEALGVVLKQLLRKEILEVGSGGGVLSIGLKERKVRSTKKSVVQYNGAQIVNMWLFACI